MCQADADPLALIDQALDLLAGADVSALPAEPLGARIARIKRQMNRLDGQLTRMVAAFDAAGAAGRDGFRDTRGWLRATLHESPGEADRRARVARGLTTLPDTADRLTNGEISLGHAAIITRTAEQVGAEAMASGGETRLLRVAERGDPAELSRVADAIRHEVDADAVAADLLAQRARRSLRVSHRASGGVDVEGQLDQESGETLLSALMPLTKPAGSADSRTFQQRMADALTDLARLALDARLLPDVHGERPHISVITPLATLQRRSGAPPGDAAWTGPMAADTLRRLACDAQISRIITGPDSEPLDVGRAARTETPGIRRARIARDRRCRFPGCRKPAAWTTGHHIQVHEGRWQIIGNPNTNDLWFVAPDGRRLRAPLPAAEDDPVPKAAEGPPAGVPGQRREAAAPPGLALEPLGLFPGIDQGANNIPHTGRGTKTFGSPRTSRAESAVADTN